MRSEPDAPGGAASQTTAAPFTELEVYGRYMTTVIGARRAGAAAASRIKVATEVARRGLMTPSLNRPLEGDAVDSLRSDGILAPASPFAPAPAFTSDIYRDYALTALLLQDGLRLLTGATEPRHALRAARLAVQALLSNDGHAALSDARAALGEVAAAHRQHRWTEVTDEALLRHPDAGRLPPRRGRNCSATRRESRPCSRPHAVPTTPTGRPTAADDAARTPTRRRRACARWSASSLGTTRT